MYMFLLKQIHSFVLHIVKVVMRIILTEIENISSKCICIMRKMSLFQLAQCTLVLFCTACKKFMPICFIFFPAFTELSNSTIFTSSQGRSVSDRAVMSQDVWRALILYRAHGCLKTWGRCIQMSVLLQKTVPAKHGT